MRLLKPWESRVRKIRCFGLKRYEQKPPLPGGPGMTARGLGPPPFHSGCPAHRQPFPACLTPSFFDLGQGGSP